MCELHSSCIAKVLNILDPSQSNGQSLVNCHKIFFPGAWLLPLMMWTLKDGLREDWRKLSSCLATWLLHSMSRTAGSQEELITTYHQETIGHILPAYAIGARPVDGVCWITCLLCGRLNSRGFVLWSPALRDWRRRKASLVTLQSSARTKPGRKELFEAQVHSIAQCCALLQASLKAIGSLQARDVWTTKHTQVPGPLLQGRPATLDKTLSFVFSFGT